MTQYPPTPAFGIFTWPAPKPAIALPSNDTVPPDIGRAHSENPADNVSAHTIAPMVLRDAPARRPLGQNMEESDSTEEGELSDGEQTSDRANRDDQFRPSRTTSGDQDTRFPESADSDEPSYSSRYSSQRPPRSRSSSPPDNQSQLDKGFQTDKKTRGRNGNARARGTRSLPVGHSNMNQVHGDRGFDPPNHPRGGRQGDRGRGGGFPRPPYGIPLADIDPGPSVNRSSGFGVGDAPPRGPRTSLPSRQNSGYSRVANGQGPYGYSEQTPQTRRDGPRPAVYNDALAAVKDLHNWNITFHDIAAETGSSITTLRKLYKELQLTVPAQLPPPPSNYNNQQQSGRPPLGPASTMINNPDEEARKIREKLERSMAETKKKNEAEAREKERKEREKREAEAAAREKERQESERQEEEKRKQLEVEAKRDILRRKLEVMNLAGKSSPMPSAITPVSSTPVQFAALHHPPPSIAAPAAKIPGLLMGQQETPETAPTSNASQNGDIVMRDVAPPPLVASPTPIDTSSVSPPQFNGIPIAPNVATTTRRKRPVAADSFTDYATPKRRFGTQILDPLIIEASEDEDDMGIKSPQQSRGKTAPPAATPATTAVTTQAEELDRKIRALKAEIEAKNKLKRKTKNGTSTAPTPSATPPVRAASSVQPSQLATAASAAGELGAKKPLQSRESSVTKSTSAEDVQREKEKMVQEETGKLEAALSKAEGEKRAISEKELQKKQQEVESKQRVEVEKEEEERQKRLREIEEKFEARRKAILEMQKEMEELEASRRALSQELRQSALPVGPENKGNDDLKCGMPEPDMTVDGGKVIPATELPTRNLHPSTSREPPASSHPDPMSEASVEDTAAAKKEEVVSPPDASKSKPIPPETPAQGQAPQVEDSDAMDIDEPSDAESVAEVAANEAPVEQNDVEMESEEEESDTDSSDSSSSDGSDSSDFEEDESSEIEASPASPHNEAVGASTPSSSPAPIPVPQSSSEQDSSTTLAATQKSEAPIIISSSNPEELNSTFPSNPLPNKFTPYVSPLPMVRSYRTNPVFLEEHLSEIKGLKYSTKIDPYKELCRFELSGGICNDTSCKFQHFRDMTVGDDELLVDLADIESVPEDLRDTYRDGLYEVIKDLRKRGIRDFPTVAKGILKFRRGWAEKQKEDDKTMVDA